jgi:hypothetical protein
MIVTLVNREEVFVLFGSYTVALFDTMALLGTARWGHNKSQLDPVPNQCLYDLLHHAGSTDHLSADCRSPTLLPF